MEKDNIVCKILGFPGRMISHSKSGYREVFPNNFVVFNSNVIVSGMGKVWHGDLDVTVDEDMLKDLSDELGKRVYVLREMDGRFENEHNPSIENAVYSVLKDNIVFDSSYIRCEDGLIKRCNKK